MNRRTLIQYAMAATTLSPFYRLQLRAAIEEFPAQSLASLRRIARMVLPATLGGAGADAQVEKLARWVREYRDGAELDHGYGRPRVRYAPASPIDAYVRQIEEIDQAARAKGALLDRLDRQTQRAIVDDALAKTGVDALPSRPSGRHVVGDLMAVYFRSTEANDHAYAALIGRETCRPIRFIVNRPKPR